MSYSITLDLPDEIYDSLSHRAKQNGRSLEVLALQWLADTVRRLPDDPLEQFIGAFDSQGADWADFHDEHLGQSLAKTMRKRNVTPTNHSNG